MAEGLGNPRNKKLAELFAGQSEIHTKIEKTRTNKERHGGKT